MTDIYWQIEMLFVLVDDPFLTCLLTDMYFVDILLLDIVGVCELEMVPESKNVPSETSGKVLGQEQFVASRPPLSLPGPRPPGLKAAGQTFTFTLYCSDVWKSFRTSLLIS